MSKQNVMNQTLRNDAKHIESKLIPKEKQIEPLDEFGFEFAKEYELPETVWIIPIICINSFRWNHETHKNRRKFFFLGQSLLYAINLFVQIFIVCFIQQVSAENGKKIKRKYECSEYTDADEDAKCNEKDYTKGTFKQWPYESDFCPAPDISGNKEALMWVALIVALTFVLADFAKGFDMFQYIYWTRANKGNANFGLIKEKYQKKEKKSDEEEGQQDTIQNEKSIKPCDEEGCDEDKYMVSTGMTRIQKAMAIFLVPVPMWIIALLLGFYGTQFLIASAEKQDLILNMIAMMFVMEIDEGMWSALVPESLKRIRQVYPTASYQNINVASFSLSCKSFILFVLVIICVSLKLKWGCS